MPVSGSEVEAAVYCVADDTAPGAIICDWMYPFGISVAPATIFVPLPKICTVAPCVIETPVPLAVVHVTVYAPVVEFVTVQPRTQAGNIIWILAVSVPDRNICGAAACGPVSVTLDDARPLSVVAP